MPSLVEPKFFASSRAQVKNTLPRVGAAIVHAHNDALAVALASDLEPKGNDLCAQVMAFWSKISPLAVFLPSNPLP